MLVPAEHATVGLGTSSCWRAHIWYQLIFFGLTGRVHGIESGGEVVRVYRGFERKGDRIALILEIWLADFGALGKADVLRAPERMIASVLGPFKLAQKDTLNSA
jgi:hypothetical protein